MDEPETAKLRGPYFDGHGNTAVQYCT